MSARLTDSSFVVLALVQRLQPATAYDLKGLAHSTVFNFWALPHTVLYTETQRLHEAGLLSAEQESGGRRRRRFSLTAEGLAKLEAWRSVATDEFLELRDPGLLRLFAGAEPHALGAQQVIRHQAQLAEYEELDRALDESDPMTVALRSTLAAGIAIERQYVRFWATVAERGAASPSTFAPQPAPSDR